MFGVFFFFLDNYVVVNGLGFWEKTHQMDTSFYDIHQKGSHCEMFGGVFFSLDKLCSQWMGVLGEDASNAHDMFN